MMNDSLLQSYHSNEGFSFGGKHLMYKNYPKINKKDIDKALSTSDIYTKYKQYSKPRKYSPIFVRNKRELFQCDLISFTQNNLPQENDDFKHLFTTIDVFSKMAWVYPIRDKKCETVLICFKDILKKCGKKPERVQTDRGTEFICKTFEKYFKDEMIFHYLSYSDRKCPVVERFNLTIQQLIYKIMEYKSTNRWIDCIEQAMKIYLNRKHSTIKMSPLEAEKPINESKVRQNLTIFFSKNSRLKPQKQKFKVGDKVRVWKFHRTFKRGYDHNFTDEFFVIHKVLKNLPVIRYELKDLNGDRIIGSYFQEELVLYTPKSFYKINIIAEKGHGKAKKFLVNWDGWPAIYNQWILASDIENFDTNNSQNFDDFETLNNTLDETPIQTTFDESEFAADNIATLKNTLNETPNQTTFDESEFAAENEGRKNDDKDLKNKTKKVFVGFINDDNIPDIIEMEKSRKNDVSKNLEDKTKKVFVGFINDDNIPDIIEMEKSKREKRKLIRKKDISSVMEKKINKREIDIPKSLNNKKVLKVNVIDDEQIKFIKKLKRK